MMETIFNVIHPFFVENKWQSCKKANTVSYRNKTDEFIVTVLPKTAEIEITIPLHEVVYKNKFNTIPTAIDYLKMHLNYYQAKQ